MQTATLCARRSGAARRFASTSSASSDGISGTADLRYDRVVEEPRSMVLYAYTTNSTQLLRAALQHIPEHGFSIRALQAAATSVPALQRLSTSPLALDQLFPSLPSRSLPSNPLRQRRQSTKPLDEDVTAGRSTAERVGPARALFDEWAREGRNKLQDTLKSDSKARSSVLDALRRRLEYNLPVLPFLPEALSTLSIPDPSKSSLPNPKAYLAHIQAIARDIKDFTRAEASLTQLATAYALAEAYQTSRTRPSFDQVLEHADSLLKRTGRYDSAFRDTWQFGGYVVDSWKNIIKSRGL